MSIIKKGRPFESDDVVSAVTKGLTTENPVFRKKLYASDSIACTRRAVLFQKVPEDELVLTNASGKLYMAIGSAVHDQVAAGLRGAGVLVAAEWRVDPMGVNLGGLIDDIIMWNGEHRVLEVKTCGKLPTQAKYEHKCQAEVYALATGLMNPIVFYVSRDVATWGGALLTRQFTIETGNDLLESVANRLAEAYVYSESSKLPPIPAHITSDRECTYCPFKEMCWGSDAFPVAPPSDRQRKTLDKRVEELSRKLIDELPARREHTLEMLKTGEVHAGTIHATR